MSIRSYLVMNRLVSSLNDRQKTCIKTLLEDGYLEIAETTLKKYLENDKVSLKQRDVHDVFAILQKPIIPINKSDIPMKELNTKANKILLKHNKLQNNSKFTYREGMGTLAKLQHEIGLAINDLSLNSKHLNTKEINSLTRNWAQKHMEINSISNEIHKEDEKLLIFDLKTFVTSINDKNKHKKLLLAAKKTKKKKRIVMRDKTNVNNNNTDNNQNNNSNNTNSNNSNHNNTNNNSNSINNDSNDTSDNSNNEAKKKKSQIANDKSHLMRQKFSQFIEFEIELNNNMDKLKKLKTDLKDIALSFGVIDNNNKCQQQNRWVDTFNNDITVELIGKDAFSRYKSETQLIKNVQNKIHKKLSKLKELMDQATWKRTGKLKGKKTMRERVDEYENKKKRRKQKRRDKKQTEIQNRKRKTMDNNNNDDNDVNQSNDDGDEQPKKKRKIQTQLDSFLKL